MCNRIGILNNGNLVALDSTKNLLMRIKTKKIIFKTQNKIKLEDETSMPGGIRLWHGDGFQIENPPQINGANMIMITNTELKVKHE